MTRKNEKNVKRRITFNWWQKMLLIAGCTALAVVGAYVFCEHITTPVYVTTVRNQLQVTDADTLINSSPALTSVEINITNGLHDELANIGNKNKGLFYRNISNEINEATGNLLKPKDLKNMIDVDEDPSDATHRTIVITITNKDPEVLRTISDSAVSQFGILLFGAPGDETQVNITETEGKTAQTRVIRYQLTDTAAAELPDRFLGKTLDLVTSLEQYLADDAFCSRIASSAGLTAKPAEIRKRIGFTTTADPKVVNLTASWNNREEAERLLTATGREISDALFGGKAEPWQTEIGDITMVSENVKEWPPTVVIMAIAGMIALIVSYALFSQQPLFDTAIVIFFILFTFLCVFPFYYLFINTISDNNLVAGGRINFIPQGIHLKNYERIMGQQELKNALFVTVGRTILGTALMVLTSAWAGYLVTKRKMWHRSFWYRALVITMYFNAGLIPWYTNMLMLGLTGNFLAYILPGMVAPYNIILVKTYIESIPGSLEESAVIDGASTTRVFMRIILPLSIPILATIAIFGAVGNWNSFQDSLLLMSSAPNLYTLQHRLYIYLNQTTSINTEQISEQMAQNLLNNGVTTKYTIAMVTIIPILLVYPFMQRFFVKGIMLGAVKG